MTRTIWNNRFSDRNQSQSTYDGWLEKHRDLLDGFHSYPCIDLGCGAGNDTAYLTSTGMSVFSMDYSISALNQAKARNPKGLFLADLRSIPVRRNCVGVAIANLSLHYFDESETRAIGEAIRDILVPGGYLMLRVNSITDVNFGADGSHRNIVDGITKYYYTEDVLRHYLDMFTFVRISEYTTTCYGKPKAVIEGVLRKAGEPGGHYLKMDE